MAKATVLLSTVGPILKLDSTGADVVQLQAVLESAGFPCGDHDGVFGGATEAAVLAFQKSVGLLADGIVGARTRSVLAAKKSAAAKAIADAPDVPVADDTAGMTVQIASRMLPGAHLDNISTHLPNVLAALQARALGERGMILVAIATIRAETAGFVPISEGISRYNTSPGGAPFNLYDLRADLGNTGRGQGAKFKGRGFIQLTGQDNYKKFGSELSLPLATQPDLANDPTIAARLLAAFIKAKEQRIKNDLLEGNLRDARKAVNGGSHGLPEFSEAYKIGNDLLPH